jgi:hypothetical protein
MSDLREILDRRAGGFQPVPAGIDDVLRRARVRQRNRRLGAGLLALSLSAGAAAGLWTALRPHAAVIPATPSVRPVLGVRIHVPGRSVGGVAYGFGSLWVSTGGEGEPGRLRRFDPQSGASIGAPIELSTSPGGEVLAAAGSVWVADPGHVTRIDPVTGQVIGVVPLPGVLAMAEGDGGVWVADEAGAEFIDARWNTVGATVVTASPAHAIAVGDGSVWVADSQGITVIDPRTMSASGVSIAVSDSNPNAIAIGDGMAWVASANGSVTGFDLPLSTATPALPRSLQQEQQLQARAQGAAKDVKTLAAQIGATQAQLAHLLSSHAPASTIAALVAQLSALQAQEAQALADLAEARSALRLALQPPGPGGASTVQVGGHPLAMIVAEGSVWVITSSEEEPGAMLLQIDPATHSLVGSGLPLEGDPFSIAYGDGALWLGDVDSGTVTRVDLKTEG